MEKESPATVRLQAVRGGPGAPPGYLLEGAKEGRALLSVRIAEGRLSEELGAPSFNKGGHAMKRILVAIALSAFAVNASAATCAVQSAEKKLAGAAKTSFLKKCEADAKVSCDASAKEKKLSGAAQTSFVKKCVADAAGS